MGIPAVMQGDMARSLRIERENGLYHVINRGNYRQDLFVTEGAHRSFERCLFEACEKCGWILEGFCVMTNHFHLVIRTPKGNLVYGMKWLQSTFANRYHRYRKVHGKLFQGRYKEEFKGHPYNPTSAIATIGDLGLAEDQVFLNALAQRSPPRLQVAIQAALARIDRKKGQA